MQKILAFAIFSTRRQEEITLLRWDDLESDRMLVRDMKHPGDKKGNNVYCELTPEALTIIQSILRDDERIFPYSADAISAAFTRACKFLGVQDLHFHDLRHEGISRLFEIGRTIPQAAAVSGHRSWSSLKRYTHIRQTGERGNAGQPRTGRCVAPLSQLCAIDSKCGADRLSRRHCDGSDAVRRISAAEH
jgi:integrase